MRLLLDTHALLWWLAGNERLPVRCRNAIENASNDVFVSAVTAWEVATKYRIGKLPLAARYSGQLADMIASQSFIELPVTIRHGQLAGSLPGQHRDPFDRMIVAQALAESLTLISNERLFDIFGVARLW